MHEVLEGKRLRELYKATGGNWGGTKVDEAFSTFLVSIIGAPVFMKFNNQHRADYLSLFQNFELKKRSVPVDNTDLVTIQIPATLYEMCPNLSNDIKQSKYSGMVSAEHGKLRITADIFKQFFQNAITDIVNHMQKLLKQVSAIQMILMVGGFSDSPFLKHAVKSRFEPQYVVITPQDASLCIMKGAVLYGHDPDKVKSRISPYSFGVAMTVPFIKGIHPEGKKITIDGEDLCDDVFDKHVEAGSEVLSGVFQNEKIYYPLTDNDTILPIVLYSSASKSPKYIDEKGCCCVGKYLVFCNRCLGDRKEDKRLKVRLKFGGTDVDVEAEDNHGKIHKARFSFANE
ncbi:hypothetical protein CHS0354_039859 [Potamilus streckersoni]|uniref:Uncharacterized protein n=1 Tax=Potamilus streckersoni TaxID=2493646 RepID=A0AAE0W0R2_9BIVA|nr:hypothetical protein CHS0354_039859 [Potamilus streckersoni]